jgi:antitoxin HicB
VLNKYSAQLAWSSEDASYVATSPEFPGLSGVADEPNDALAELGEAIEMALEALHAAREPVPLPREQVSHSGQIRLRMPRSLHSLLASCADVEGVSLNTLAVSLLARGIGERSRTLSAQGRREPAQRSRRRRSPK